MKPSPLQGAATLGSTLLLTLTACNGLPSSTPGPSTVPQTYIAAVVSGTPLSTPTIYTFDDTTHTFVQSVIAAGAGTAVRTTGAASVLARGLRSLTTGYATGVTYTPPVAGGYAVELAGQAGGVVQLTGQPATPLGAAQACPASSAAQTYEFITLPGALATSGTASGTWNPATDTAFGAVSVSGDGSAIQLSHIQQFTLPVGSAVPGAPTLAYPASVAGICALTPYGNTISIPGTVTITNPGGGESVSASAILGVNPSGLLVEWNGSLAGSYENALGAGTGAIGVPQPAQTIDTGAVVAAQYEGFISGSGSVAGTASFSTVASFGFPSLPATCASVASPTSTLMYGGDFNSNGNNPASAAVQQNGGYGDCDFALDLGPQSASSNGLYPQAKAWVGAGFSGNKTGATYSFPAVGVVGQVQGKFVVLLIGKDSAQGWSLYLMQSN